MTGTIYGIVVGYDGSPGGAQRYALGGQGSQCSRHDADGLPGLDP